MHPYAKHTAIVLSAGFIFLSGAASGSEVYKWVGVDGSTHYSEVPPDSDLASIEILEIAVADPVQPDSRSYQSVLDVANSLEASRLERERLRLEKNKLRLQNEQARQPDPPQNEVYYAYPVARYNYPRHFRHYGKHKNDDRHNWPRPRHELHTRGDRPGWNQRK